jgi:toxin CcdB
MLSMIRQFDVIANPLAAVRGTRPYVLCVQYYLLDQLGTRLMATLTTERVDHLLPRLHPDFEIEGRVVHLLPYDLITLPLRVLKRPIMNLESERNRITAALDLVFTGV